MHLVTHDQKNSEVSGNINLNNYTGYIHLSATKETVETLSLTLKNNR